MPALIPRRRFAAPLVAISLGACHHPEPIHANPPSPPPAASALDPNHTWKWNLFVDTAASGHPGRCETMNDSLCHDPPPGQGNTCNTPAVEYPCPPADLWPAPAPADQMLDESIGSITRQAGETHCSYEAPPPPCPPAASCNPGPPVAVPCPTE